MENRAHVSRPPRTTAGRGARPFLYARQRLAAAALLRWPQLPPPELGAGVTHAVTWPGRRPRRPPLPGVQARPDSLFALQSGRHACAAWGPTASQPLPPRTPTPALSPGRPYLSRQQEFPFFCLPQLHHVRQGLNRCTNTKKHTAFLMHGKERLPVSLSSPVHPPHQNKPPFPSRSRGHPRIRTQWRGVNRQPQ